MEVKWIMIGFTAIALCFSISEFAPPKPKTPQEGCGNVCFHANNRDDCLESCFKTIVIDYTKEYPYQEGGSDD